MHLLAANAGTIDDGSEPRDLAQSPGDVVVLSAADTELALLANAHNTRLTAAGEPTLRLANFLNLKHNYSVDLYIEKTLSQAKLVVLRLLGGKSYWAYGLEQLAAHAANGAFQLVVLPGDDKPDASLEGLSTVDAELRLRLWSYLTQGGARNADAFLATIAAHLGRGDAPPAARPLLKAGLYRAAEPAGSAKPAGQAAIIFYRALMQSGDTAAVDALLDALSRDGLASSAIYVASLRDRVCVETVASLLADSPPDVILNFTAFATSKPGDTATGGPLACFGAPVLQVVSSSETEAAWRDGTRGLCARDIAMHVALPEIDGRLATRAIAFKSGGQLDPATQHYVVRSEPRPDRVAFVAAQAAALTRLRHTPAADRRVAIILANYPNRDARIANGVGLDTPQSAINVLNAMAGAGYAVNGVPADGNALIAHLRAGVANAHRNLGDADEYLPRACYRSAFERLPDAVREAVTARWGPPEDDPLFGEQGFAIAARSHGNAIVAIQPARGYNIDPKATYHDPALVPPHGYLAFYIWLRESAGIHAAIHLGKHGNLEWLPGKALALSAECFPEVALGPLPNIYPFIVNDPGEGSQAKRRTSAVIIDHLTPPMTRADTYGPLKELEVLVDEYYEAAGLDEPRRKYLQGEILATSARLGLDKDCGIAPSLDDDAALQEIDNHLCEIKEMQIRDGLHIFGEAPVGRLRTDLLAALARVPRCKGEGGDASLVRALAADLDFGAFDPLGCNFGEPWDGPQPPILAHLTQPRPDFPSPLEGEGKSAPWRTNGDTVERLELLAAALIDGSRPCDPDWTRTSRVLAAIRDDLAPRLDRSGTAEIAGLLRALDGRFVPPGPSGAPTRGRPDVLPTGRNFYSLDSRTLPTRAAWELGKKSAELVVERYLQDHGDWPKAFVLSAWGTSNMRTGGDDIAQALAFLGARPAWEAASGRVTGFEIIPLAKLDRPRIDVTFRVSGFFRDAFPAQMDLLDSAVRAIAALDEEPGDNPLAARARSESARLEADGLDAATAMLRAATRIFGSKPGAYGAGLQAMLDENLWADEADLAGAYLEWGQYAYGGGREGEADRAALERRLSSIDAVLHNQDNREHDLLDSDDYYQFEGGLAVTVKTLTGKAPPVYHNDHSRPERPVVRALDEEIGRVVRGRAANPKWIAGVMRHGYKGAFEIAATVDYLFAFAATTGAVRDHHFDALYDAYLDDDTVQAFLRENNDAALLEIAGKFTEAITRGLWSPRRNSVHDVLANLRTTPADSPQQEMTA